MNKAVDGFNGSASLISVAQMASLGVVVVRPGVQVHLQSLDALAQGLSHLQAWELGQEGAVEALDEAVLLGAACCALRSKACSGLAFCSASQRSSRVPSSFSYRVFCIAVDDSRRPCRAGSAANRLQP